MSMKDDSLRARLLAALRDAGEDGMSLGELLYALDATSALRRQVRQELRTLTHAGLVARVERDLFAVVDSTESFEGTLTYAQGGFRVRRPGSTDVEVPGFALNGAIAGDRVRGVVTGAALSGGPLGTVEGIVAEVPRAFRVELGRYRGLWVGRSDTMDEPVLVVGDLPGRPRPGEWIDVVVVDRRRLRRGRGPFPEEIVAVRHPDSAAKTAPTRPDRRAMLRYLGPGDRDATVILDGLAAGLGVNAPFPDEAVAIAGSAEAPSDEALIAETDDPIDDLTGIPFVTIDGADAKDFDDAVFAEKLDGGAIRLWVAIADVSFYVPEGSALDEEARRRGCSVYLPGRVYPMLPPILSDDICSLRPGELRRCAWVRLDIAEDGSSANRAFGFGMLRSRARLTYEQVQERLDGDAGTGEVDASIAALDAAWRRLHEKRLRRGMLDLDLPEPAIALTADGTGVEHVLPHPRLASHRLIEECMVAANEAVAGYMLAESWPSIYRVHGAPSTERLRDLRHLLTGLGGGTRLPAEPGPHEIEALIESFADTPQSRVVSWLVLRTLPRAEYAVGGTGHYGLGAPAYLHFTSPIRRYPDLEVHRVLRRALAAGGAPPEDEREAVETRLRAGAVASNAGEQIATTAERWSDRLLRALYMLDHVGDQMPATVSEVSRFGLFVTVTEPYVEGLVPISSLGDEYFELDERHGTLTGERTRTRYRIGDSLDVVCVEVRAHEGKVAFAVANTERAMGRKRKPTGRRGGRRPSPRSTGRRRRRG